MLLLFFAWGNFQVKQPLVFSGVFPQDCQSKTRGFSAPKKGGFCVCVKSRVHSLRLLRFRTPNSPYFWRYRISWKTKICGSCFLFLNVSKKRIIWGIYRFEMMSILQTAWFNLLGIEKVWLGNPAGQGVVSQTSFVRVFFHFSIILGDCETSWENMPQAQQLPTWQLLHQLGCFFSLEEHASIKITISKNTSSSSWKIRTLIWVLCHILCKVKLLSSVNEQTLSFPTVKVSSGIVSSTFDAVFLNNNSQLGRVLQLSQALTHT